MNTIIKEIQEGNQTNYEWLEKQFHPAIHRLINLYDLGYDRDEFFQIGRITFYNCVMKYDESKGAKLITYFMTTLAHTYNHLKRKRVNDVEFDEEEFADKLIEDESSFEYLIDSLDEYSKSLIRDFFWYGYTQQEIADKNGESQSSITKKLRIILDKLRYNIYERNEEDEKDRV